VGRGSYAFNPYFDYFGACGSLFGVVGQIPTRWRRGMVGNLEPIIMTGTVGNNGGTLLPQFGTYDYAQSRPISKTPVRIGKTSLMNTAARRWACTSMAMWKQSR